MYPGGEYDSDEDIYSAPSPDPPVSGGRTGTTLRNNSSTTAVVESTGTAEDKALDGEPLPGPDRLARDQLPIIKEADDVERSGGEAQEQDAILSPNLGSESEEAMSSMKLLPVVARFQSQCGGTQLTGLCPLMLALPTSMGAWTTRHLHRRIYRRQLLRIDLDRVEASDQGLDHPTAWPTEGPPLITRKKLIDHHWGHWERTLDKRCPAPLWFCSR